MKLLTCLLFLHLSLQQAQAADDKRDLIEQLLVLTRTEELTKAGQIEGFKMGLEMAPAAIPADKKAQMIAAGEEIMAEVMPWSALKEDFINLYAEHYTVEELRTVVELCKDPRYQTLVTKQIAMIGPSMAIGQKYGQLMMPKLMQASTRIMQED